MSKQFVRLVAVLAVVAGILGNTGVARVAHAAPPSVSTQSGERSRSLGPQPLDLPALTIPPASSLGVQFIQVATAANVSGNATIIDHPLTNGNPSAILLVTPNYNPGGVGGLYDNHPIGVWYNGGTWRIFNQDAAAMPVGAAFNVIIPTAGANVFVHTTTAGNTGGNVTTIDNALTNGNPNANVFITPNYDPGGACPCAYVNHPIGVYYSGGKWNIFNQDIAAMPVNASFNVFVPSAGAGVFVHTATAGNIVSNRTIIDNFLTNGNPNAIVFVTPNWNPGGVGGTYDNHNIGAYYFGDTWRIFNQDMAAMPVNAAFNVLVLVPTSDTFVHTATVGNSSGNHTFIDNALTNSHPNAIVFATPNWNPGGVGGTYANFPIGVFYDTGVLQWSLFNQNGIASSMPTNAAFNVLIPNPDTSVFVHKATASNISGDSTIIDYPLTNSNPGAIVFVTPNWNPGGVGGTYNNHPIGVLYWSGKWMIVNQDLAAMPVNASFNVFVPTAGANVFVHMATAGNTAGDRTIIDNPLTNGNPNAIVAVTLNNSAGGIVLNDPIGVYYSGGKWRIFNQDLAAMPVGAAFNVYVYTNRLYLPLILR